MDRGYPVPEVPCAEEGCMASFKSHRHGQIQAHKNGWFHSRAEQVSWCPEHVPEWVAGWRAKKQREQGDQ
ncbi:hypothetical protein SEA_SKOG_59 [Gordonia phage Skog]|uniref:Uncharacterized protein n=1 Tax=Gordonia phage Skog TaxID=2704033 RepID=A0A6G6XJC6_9CAUD|nr:hypothetical protein KHQ85_gp059 [Gordonia phage Skog]QIG58211.1 hypothetical protein SEA_SKOG_59 [Gordonia phage Skog]